MVFINDKKFACATCIKGHRVSGCTHTDRPLFEVKKKGRPATQCQCCKDRRKSGNVHSKCVCGETKGPEVILPPGHPGLEEGSNPYAAGPSGTSTDDEDQDMDGAESSTAGASGSRKGKGKAKARRETKKGRPGDQATFPNGLRDVHEMAAAAEVLTELNEDTVQRAERTVASLLNPCTCKHTGICKCCEPKRPRNRRPDHSRSSSADRGRRDSTDNLVQLFKSRAPSPSPYGSTASSPNPSNPSPISPAGRYSASNTLPVPGVGVTVENQHHPAHTSRYVHKTKLYSPYSSEESGHRRRGSASSRRSISGSSVRSLRLRPLADMHKFLSAALNPDGSTATEINRSAVGLPGISSFDEMAKKAGVKVEPIDEGAMEIDGDEPLSFPTQEDVVLGACTCGENCDCPGCATHPNGEGSSGTHECGLNCRSHFDCGAEVSVPSGMMNIDQLLAVAASAVPKPVRHRPLDQLATDTSLLPPSAAFSPDAAAGLGVVELKPLQCCNGRCQCTPGTCGCKDDCCGCCVRCACAEDAPTPTQDNPDPSAVKAEGGCCGGTGSARQSLSISTVTPSYGPSTITPPRLSPNPPGLHAFNMSPLHSPLIQANSAQYQHRHSLSASSLPSPLMGPSTPGLLHPPAPGSSSGSSCCSPASNSAPLLQVNTTLQPSPFTSPAHSPAAENFYRLPSPSLGPTPMLDTLIPPADGPSSAPANSFDPSQGIRRASSPAHVAAVAAQGPMSGPVYGHSHSQSLSASTGKGRRSTVTGGASAGVQRSASTGKQASKALALNQQANHAGQHMHVRPILPKPNAAAAATLLVPSRPGPGGSSRPTSPSGRRRSSSSLSRAPSPGPSGIHAGSGRPSAHQHRASESAIGSTGLHGQQDIMPLPMVTTSAPGETRQEVSFDPNEDNRDSSEERHEQEEEAARQQQQQQQRGEGMPIVPLQITPELAQMFQAWLVQNGHVQSPTIGQSRPQYQGGMGDGPDMSAFNQPTQFSPTAQQPFGPSNSGIFGFDTPNQQQHQQQEHTPQNQMPDFSGFSFDPNQYASASSQYLQQAMNELNASMPDGGGNTQSTMQPLDVFAAMQAQMMQSQGQLPLPLDQVQQQYMVFQAQAQAEAQARAHALAQQQQQQHMHLPHSTPLQQQRTNDTTGYFGGMPNQAGFGGMSAQMSPHGSSMGQQQYMGQRQGQGMRIGQDANGWQMPLQQQNSQQHIPLEHSQQPSQQQQSGHMIDLSKPLDSTDVDRIIKALQEQQNRQAQQAQNQSQVLQSPMHEQVQPRPNSSQGFSIEMPPPKVPPPRPGQSHGHSLSQNNVATSGALHSVALTPNNVFGFDSPSGSGLGSQLSSSAPQSSGILHSGQGVLQQQQQQGSQGLYDPNMPYGLGVGIGVGGNAGSGVGHGLNNPTHTPSFSISSFDSLLAPPSSESSGSGMLSHSGSGRTSFTIDTDQDVFDQFILENSGEGFDLSALDLDAVALDAEGGMGVGGGGVGDIASKGQMGQAHSQGQQAEPRQGHGPGQKQNGSDKLEPHVRTEDGDEAILSQYTFL